MAVNPLFKIQSGLYVLCAAQADRHNGCIINTAMQVTAEPEKLSVTVAKENLTCSMIGQSGRFLVAVLSQQADIRLIGRFGYKTGSNIDKFAEGLYQADAYGVYYPTDGVCATISCRVESTLDVGSHITYVGLVDGGETRNADEPMTYAYYHNVLKGKAPKNAPTFGL